MEEDRNAAARAGDKPSASDPAVGDGHRRRTLGEDAGEAVEATRGMARQLFGDVRHAAEEMIEERKARAAEGVQGVADALRRTAGSLKGENEAIARYAEQAADTVARLSDTVRGQHLGDVIAELDDFARRQPALFLVGAVAAGFAAGRFIAASAEREEPRWRVERRAAHRHPDAAEPPLAGYGDARVRERA